MLEQEAAGLLADESFINYCLARNATDIARWEVYLNEHPHQKEHIEELKAIVLLTSRSVKDVEMHTQLEKLKERISYHDENRQASPVKKPVTVWWKAAAVFAGIFLAGILIRYYFSGSFNPAVTKAVSFTTQKTERKSFVLPDGSKVILNAESRILLADHFNEKDRMVELSGEAFFDVAHDASRPFVVKTDKMDVKVLGTAFNVRAYDGDEISETSLIRGSIELSLKEENRKITLRPNEKYLLRAGNNAPEVKKPVEESALLQTTASGLLPVRVSKEDTAIVEVSWTEDKLVFVDESFEQLAKQLSRWYGMSIEIVDPELKHVLYTASFRNEKVEDVLAALQFTKAFNFEIKNNTIMIYK
ncbi:MAG: DUF4974 domain-containing protein [Chitinophagaceae bacterium]|nr:DUF4974 domain-containing protein [Chitinophagaceae bacterium]